MPSADPALSERPLGGFWEVGTGDAFVASYISSLFLGMRECVRVSGILGMRVGGSVVGGVHKKVMNSGVGFAAFGGLVERGV